jgi:anti-anti-sigma factor
MSELGADRGLNGKYTSRRNYEFVQDEIGTVKVLHVLGEVDLSGAPELEASLERLAESAEAIVLDLSACRYFDSTTIRILIRGVKRWGERFAIAIPDDCPTRRILRACNLENVLPIEPDVFAATERISIA